MRVVVILMVLGAAACGNDNSEAGGAATTAQAASTDADAAYREDVRRICNVQELSGALDQDPGMRAIVVAKWLGDNLVTQRARDLMAQQARLDPAGKHALFLSEATKAGLPDCATAEAWK